MKKLSVNLVKCFLLIIISVLLVSITILNETSKQTDILQENQSNITDSNYTINSGISQYVQNSNTTKYKVSTNENMITVYMNGEIIEISADTVPVDSLPLEDKILLENGVEFSNISELISFLENYE